MAVYRQLIECYAMWQQLMTAKVVRKVRDEVEEAETSKIYHIIKLSIMKSKNFLSVSLTKTFYSRNKNKTTPTSAQIVVHSLCCNTVNVSSNYSRGN